MNKKILKERDGKMKDSKGISLIVMVTIIVVLLILVIVSIGVVKNSQKNGNEENVATDYEKTQTEEGVIAVQNEAVLNSQLVIGTWQLEEDGETVTNKATGETKKIGGTFTNDEVLVVTGGTKSSYTGTWTILGVENGKLKLVSTSNVVNGIKLGYDDPGAIVAVSAVNENALTDAEKLERSVWSYNHVVETLTTTAKTATGIASAKSITVEDLEAKDVLNITDEQKRTLDSDYGKTYRYYFDGDADKGKIYSQYLDFNEEDTEGNWSSISKSLYNIFTSYDKVIDGTETNKNNVVKLKHSFYSSFNFTDAQKTKFANSLANGDYWLASPCVDCDSNRAYFAVHFVGNGRVAREVLFNSKGVTGHMGFGVRAVVFI